tara:strand:- start:240 stop:428 length:189 start_codon:yes stop_codon:yes gene_type:complete
MSEDISFYQQENSTSLEEEWKAVYKKYRNAKTSCDQSNMEKWYKELTKIEIKLHAILYGDEG